MKKNGKPALTTKAEAAKYKPMSPEESKKFVKDIKRTIAKIPEHSQDDMGIAIVAKKSLNEMTISHRGSKGNMLLLFIGLFKEAPEIRAMATQAIMMIESSEATKADKPKSGIIMSSR